MTHKMPNKDNNLVLKTKDEVLTLITKKEGILADLYRKKYDDLATKERRSRLINDQIKKLKELESITITAPFNLDSKLLDILWEKVVSTFGTSVVLDIRIDGTILGGCIFLYKGKYYDYSLRKILDAVVNEYEL
jgi:F0F1-type ATP synthase delta subunit